MESIRIKKQVVDRIINHAKKDLPNEACGYLAGKEGIITTHFELTNIDKSPEHFTFDPEEQFDVLKKTRANGLDILANYHSHPKTPARPSQEDVKLAYDPNIKYFIISLATDTADIKAFKIVNSKVEKIKIEITD